MRRGRPAGPGCAPISVRDVTDMVTEPATLESGHPLRGLRCLLCGMMIGGRPFTAVTVVDWRQAGCSCGSVPTVTYLTCADHRVQPDGSWIAHAITRWHRHHSEARP